MTQAPEVIGRDLIRPRDAAEIVGVTVRTLSRWADKGYLVSVRTPAGRRFYRRADIDALLTVNDNGSA